jgi:hypothetical protein
MSEATLPDILVSVDTHKHTYAAVAITVPFRPGPRLLSAGVLAAFTAFDRG